MKPETIAALIQVNDAIEALAFAASSTIGTDALSKVYIATARAKAALEVEGRFDEKSLPLKDPPRPPAPSDPWIPQKTDRLPDFETELKALLNKHSKENGSNTPDCMLARYLCTCLESFNDAVRQRDAWYGISSRARGSVI